ncbi:hypothetical protein [Klebsiella michiganensis]|uniref:hypothetical protein n=1 Tax=Klebsiella michiganensis TaxID=1134687 RepID=UPI003F4FB53C
MSNMVFWEKNAPCADWRQAFLVDGIYRACPDASGWTLAQLNAGGERFELIPADEAYQRYSDGFIRPVTEISETRYHDMLEVLPPLDWHFNESGGPQSFKLAEMYCGNVTAIFAQYGARFFELRDRVTLTHQAIIERVKAFIDGEGQ